MHNINWQTILNNERQKPYFIHIINHIKQSRCLGKIIYPPNFDVLNALKLTPFDKIKVVIFGQDPYHEKEQAHGLAFSVQPQVKIPPSLKNIYKELTNDFSDFKLPHHGCLTNWAKQGVLLLNSILTVEEGKAGSHTNLGWQTFTDKIIQEINLNKKNIVFILWGNFAQKKENLIDSNKHLILKAAHPSPLSAYRGFFGCRHFSKTNQYLLAHHLKPIDWTPSLDHNAQHIQNENYEFISI